MASRSHVLRVIAMRALITTETILEEVRMGANAFAYEECDIPAGMTLAEYRRARHASEPAALEPRDVTHRKPRRRAHLVLPAGSGAALAAGVKA
jgi:hypothetical protein